MKKKKTGITTRVQIDIGQNNDIVCVYIFGWGYFMCLKTHLNWYVLFKILIL